MKKGRNKFIAVLLATSLTFALTACGGNTENGNANSENSTIENNVTNKSLYEQGMEVVALMAEMTRTEEYVQAHTGSPEIMEIVQGIAEGDFSTPKAVYSITAKDEVLFGLLEIDEPEGVSEELKKALLNRTLGSLMTQINGMAGVEKLAASSVCTVGKTFVNEQLTDNVIYLYTFENALPVAVTFTVGEDGAVSAGGNFIMYEDFTCDSIEEIQAFLAEISVEVKEVAAE